MREFERMVGLSYVFESRDELITLLLVRFVSLSHTHICKLIR
jgi:hypothetical protein